MKDSESVGGYMQNLKAQFFLACSPVVFYPLNSIFRHISITIKRSVSCIFTFHYTYLFTSELTCINFRTERLQ